MVAKNKQQGIKDIPGLNILIIALLILTNYLFGWGC